MIAIIILFLIENLAILTFTIISIVKAETQYNSNELNFSKIKQPKLKDMVENLGLRKNLEIIYTAGDFNECDAMQVNLNTDEDVSNFITQNSNLRVLKINFYSDKTSIKVEGKGKEKNKN